MFVVAFFVIIIIIAFVAIFSVQNAMPVAISFLFWKFEASLAIVIFLSVLTGFITGIIANILFRMRPSPRKEQS